MNYDRVSEPVEPGNHRGSHLLNTPNLQKLLIGTWKSDKRRTLRFCHRYHLLMGTKKRRFGNLFGHLTIRYTRSRVYYTLRETEWSAKYDVIAQDSKSIVLRLHSDSLWKQAEPVVVDLVKQLMPARLQQVHFQLVDDTQYYWIGCGTFCEWFRRDDTLSTKRKRVRRAIGSAR
ncbi:hypothetical protein GC207_02005 [bacterium]|nr:hypothetical protein [bacterium]